jgi:hypothetical protein
MLIFAGVFAVTVLVGVGFNYPRRGSWVLLSLTFFGMPVALFISLWATGIGHPSGELYLAKLFLPFMVFPFTLRLVTTDDAAGVVCFWQPLLQVLVYGVILAGGYYRGRLCARAAWIVGVHIFATAIAFTFHHGGYLDAK